MQLTIDLSSTEQLRARCELYALLARLYLRPLDEAMLQTLRAIPGLAEQIAATPAAVEELQVAYEGVFGRNVYPYESLYRDRDLMLNTATADRVAQLYATCGFSAGINAAATPDHLGLELGLMAHLLELEIAALAGKDQAAQHWAYTQQGRCLHEHLACWVPICTGAIERIAAHPLYLTIAELTLELVLSDLERVVAPGSEMPGLESRQAVSPHLSPMPAPAVGKIALPPGAEPSEDEGAWGVNRVVRQLITPDEVGVFLSRGDLGVIGRRLGLSTPIGDRFQMLRGLFESAGQFELIAPLLEALDALLTTEAKRVEALVGTYPAWNDGAQHWSARLARGRALLEELRIQTCTPLDEPVPTAP